MKLHAITFAAALFAAHLATAQVEQPMVGTVTDTVSSTVILGSDMATQAQQEAALKAEKAQLKDQEKDLKAQEKAIKEKAKQEEAAKKEFLKTIVPKWIETAKKEGRLVTQK